MLRSAIFRPLFPRSMVYLCKEAGRRRADDKVVDRNDWVRCAMNGWLRLPDANLALWGIGNIDKAGTLQDNLLIFKMGCDLPVKMPLNLEHRTFVPSSTDVIFVVNLKES